MRASEERPVMSVAKAAGVGSVKVPVKDSKLRVELMEKAMKESNFAQAAELAITVEEQERIEQLSAKR